MNVKANNGWFFYCFILFYLNGLSLPLMAAQLELSVTDDKGRPLANTVAALVPIKQINYSDFPIAIMDQQQNMFVPGVLALRVNTLVNFPNRDDVRHHVYSFSPAKKFELRLYHGMTAEPVLFDQAGTVVLGCNIHDSMVAYIYVVDTDYFAIADEQGKIHINAPEGEYRMQIFHPQMKGNYPEAAITLVESQAVNRTVVVNNLTTLKKTEPTDEFSDLF